jgi:hypothetical protein
MTYLVIGLVVFILFVIFRFDENNSYSWGKIQRNNEETTLRLEKIKEDIDEVRQYIFDINNYNYEDLLSENTKKKLKKVEKILDRIKI